MKSRLLLATVCIGISLTACSRPAKNGVSRLKGHGMVLMTDQSYAANVFASNQTMPLASPEGLLWHKGKLYIADEGGDAVRVWSQPNGIQTLLEGNSLGVQSPERLVIDADDNVFFTDDDAGGLWELDARGNRRLVAGKDKGLISTKGIALAPDGSLLVGDQEQHEIFRVTRSGAVTEFLSKQYGITKPRRMIYDDAGNLYIGDNKDHVLYLLDRSHELHRLIDRAEAFSPEEMCYVKGTLYITDARNGKLYIYTPNDQLRTIASFIGVLQNVHGITLDDQGNIYVGVQTDLEHHIGHIIKLSKETAQVARR